MTVYVGNNSNVAEKVNLIHAANGGLSTIINRVYVGVNDVARLVYENFEILPQAYQQVLYIQSSGTQFIDTGVNPTGYRTGDDIRSYIKMAFTSTSGEQCPWGVRNTSGDTYLCIGHSSGTWYLGSTDVTHSATGATVDVVYELDAYFGLGNQNLTIKDTQTSTTATIQRSNPTSQYYSRNAYLCASNASRGGTYRRICSMRLYNAKCWINDTLQYNYYPCYEKSSGTVGVYDIVNGKFLTNAGTGTFSAGPNNVEPL